jgi:hypothetical protein
MTNTRLSSPAPIGRLLRTNVVMTIKQLRQALNGRARSSVFRDLKQIDVITSYSHTGQYHALKSTARFDQHGLWFVNDIGFARYGTLKATLVRLIGEAQAGMTHKELKKLLRVAVQNTLTELVKSNIVGRRLLPNRLSVYVSQDHPQGAAQFERRLSLLEHAAETALPPDTIRIEILLEVIRSTACRADEKTLGLGLRERGIAIEDREVTAVLVYYDIKKNGL